MTPRYSFIDKDTGIEIVREMTDEEYRSLLESHLQTDKAIDEK